MELEPGSVVPGLLGGSLMIIMALGVYLGMEMVRKSKPKDLKADS